MLMINVEDDERKKTSNKFESTENAKHKLQYEKVYELGGWNHDFSFPQAPTGGDCETLCL